MDSQTTTDYKAYLQQPSRRPWFGWLLWGLYTLNATIIRSQSIEQKLWDWLRLELFYLAGDCQHSGQCCSKLMLYRQGKPVKTMAQFQALKTESPTYTRFQAHAKGTQISSFSCSCLTSSNWCNDYKNRPQLCRNYPFSNYINGDTLYESCGYHVARTTLDLPPFPGSLQTRIATVTTR